MLKAFENLATALRNRSRGALARPSVWLGLLGVAALGLCISAQAATPVRVLVTNGNVVNLQVTVDKAETLAPDKAFADVLVGNPQTADVVALTNKMLYVLGKKVGTTSITLISTDKTVMGVVNVEVTHDVEGLRARLRQHVPGGNITVSSVGGKLLLTGSVRDSTSLSRALAIAEQVAPQGVTNALTVRGSQQVMLEVRFIEASRDSSRALGVGWEVIGSDVKAFSGALALSAGGAPLFGLPINSAPFGAAIARLLDNGTKDDG